MKRLIALALLAIAALPALETPLIITNTGGTATVSINPALGTMTYYLLEDGRLNRRSSANFVTDLQSVDQMIVDITPDGDPYSALRMGGGGAPVTRPAYAEFFATILDKLGTTKAEKEAGIESLGVRARRTEKDYWSKEHPYDGVVRAALAQNYLMLAVPSKRALLVYEVASEDFKFVAWRYFGTELYIPHVYGSNPTPAEIVRQLPEDLKEERRKQIEAQYQALAEAKSQTIDTKPSDVWLAAGAGERFAVLDIANNHLMSYEFNGKFLELKSIRNIEVDLMIPTAFQSQPDIATIFQAWKRDKSRQAWLGLMGMENDLDAFKVYVESRQAAGSGKTSPLQASVSVNSGDIVVDFGDRRKIAVYRFAAGTPTMDMVSLRDYTVDVGVSLLDGDIRQRMLANQLYGNAVSFKNAVAAFLTLRTALQMSPVLVREAEKNKRLVDKVKDQPGYAEMIQKAIEEATKIEEDIKRRKEEAQKRREERQKGK